MSDEVGRVALGLDLNTASFSKKLNSIANKAAATLAAAFSVKALTSFGQQCIELGSDLAEVQNVVDVTFPSMSAMVDEFAQSAARSFGLSETMAKKFSGTFGAMAKAMGFSEQAAYDMSTALTGLAGDVASFYNISQDEAYTKLKSVFSGETETLKDLGVMMTQANLDAYALANGYGKTTSAMSEMEKTSLRYAFVLDALSDATGDYMRTNDSWANQSKSLALQAQSAMAAVGQGLISLLTPAIQALNRVMERVVAAAQAFRDLAAAIMGSDGQSVSDNLSSASSSAGALEDSLTAASQAGQQLDDATGVASKSLGKSSKAAQALKRSLEGFDQITRVSTQDSGFSGSGGSDGGLDTEGISGALDVLGQTMESVEEEANQLAGVSQILQTAWEHLKEAAGKLADTISGALQWGLENVLAPLAKWTIEEAAPALVESLASALSALNSVCQILKEPAKRLWDDFLKPICDATFDTAAAGLNGIATAFGMMADALETLEGFLSGELSLSDAWEKLKKDCLEGYTDLVGIFDQLMEDLKQCWISLTEGFGRLVEPFGELILGESFQKDLAADLERARETVTGFFDDVADFASSIPSGLELLRDFFDDVGEFAVSIPVRFEETKKSLAKKWDEITSGIEEKVGELSAKATTKASEVTRWWSDVTKWWKEKTSNLSLKAVTAASSVKSWWSDATKWWQDKTSNLRAQAVTKAQEIKAAWENVSKWWKDKKASFTISITSKISDLKKWFNNSVISPLNSKIHKIPLLKSVSIPYLAQGGYVRANTPQLAVIGDNRHQGEIVAPEDKLREMALAAARAASGGDTGRLEALLQAVLEELQNGAWVRIDPESLRRYFIQQTNQNTRITGSCELYT